MLRPRHGFEPHQDPTAAESAPEPSWPGGMPHSAIGRDGSVQRECTPDLPIGGIATGDRTGDSPQQEWTKAFARWEPRHPSRHATAHQNPSEPKGMATTPEVLVPAIDVATSIDPSRWVTNDSRGGQPLGAKQPQPGVPPAAALCITS